jgi:hypothetical protein
MAMAETWLYYCDPETKQQSMEGRHRGTPSLPQKIPSAKSGGNLLASIFGNQESIILNDYLSKDQTINTEYYSSLLMQLKNVLKEKSHAARW